MYHMCINTNILNITSQSATVLRHVAQYIHCTRSLSTSASFSISVASTLSMTGCNKQPASACHYDLCDTKNVHNINRL